MKAKEKPHYVNNKEFSLAVVEYVKILNEAKAKDEPLPVVPNYIASCFLKISEGLSHKANFIRYTYREEMMMDAVEDCLKAIKNYDISVSTRTGNPNAFGYFTQICYYAFLRRIAKEKKQQDIKLKWIEKAGFEEFLESLDGEEYAGMQEMGFIDELRTRIDRVKEVDKEIKEYAKKEKQQEKLEMFMG